MSQVNMAFLSSKTARGTRSGSLSSSVLDVSVFCVHFAESVLVANEVGGETADVVVAVGAEYALNVVGERRNCERL